MVGWVVASTPLGLRLKGEWAMVEGNPVAALVRFAEHYGSIIPHTGREVFFLREGLPHRGTVSTVTTSNSRPSVAFEDLHFSPDGGRRWIKSAQSSATQILFFSSYEDLLEHYDAPDRTPWTPAMV